MALTMCCCNNTEEKVQEEPAPVPPLGFWPEEYNCDTSRVKTGETFPGMMTRFGMESQQAYALTALCRDSIFNVRRQFRADDMVIACHRKDSLNTLEYVLYLNDRVRTTVFHCTDSLYVWVHEKPVTVEDKTCDVTIHTSLWADMLEQGTSPLLIVNLADIYAWTVNFFGLQDGDRFRAIYRQKVCEGEVVEIVKVDFAIFDGGGKQFCAIYFDQGDKGNKYWNEKGESMKKAFLKAPLRYNRVSSRFSYRRKHPVTGKVRPHTGVDYAAPKGTPVHAIGDGTVTVCGWDPKGGGKHIKIRHANGYQTAYLHLSGYGKGIKSGARVSQGQTIGFVGSTGRSTGPHLDFRVWKDGKPIDPLKMISPPSAPLSKENIDSLKILYDKYLAIMSESESQPQQQSQSQQQTQ